MFAFLQFLVVTVISYAAFGGAVWALIDAARRRPAAFTNAGKQSKNVWLLILGIATALLFISLPYPFGGGGGPFDLLGIASAVAVVIYFVGVKPALGPHYRGPKGGGRAPSGW
jgi:hypothetical protein